MLHHHTHTDKMNVLKRFVMRLSFVVLLFISISSNVFGADYFYTYNHNCGTGGLNAADILDYGESIGAFNSGHRVNGSFDNLGGLTLVDPLVTDENASFTNFVVGNSYVVRWNKNDVHFYYITISIVLSNAPTATFVADNPTPCGTPYDAKTTLTLSGGISPYDITITRAPEGDYNNTIYAAGDTTINFGSQSTDRTYSLTTVSDKNGCMVAGLPINASFTLTATPTPINITGTSVCSPNTLNLSIATPEAGITYYLAQNGTKVAGTEKNSAPYTWSTTTIGSYEIWAIDPCGGPDVKMSGGPFLISNTPNQTYSITGVDACSDIGTVIGLSDSESGVLYQLHNGTTFIGSPEPGINNAISFPNIKIPGSYKVVAISGCGNYDMDGANMVTVNANPSSYILEDGAGNTTVKGCAGIAVEMYLSGSQPNVSYQVYDSSNNAVGGPVNGGASPLFLTNTNTADTYYVIGTSMVNGCTTTMGSMSVSFVTPPSATIAAGQAFEKCESSTATFGVTIDISPTNQGPWDLVISDGSTDYNFTANTSTDTWTTPNVANTSTYTITSIEDRNGCVNAIPNGGSVTVDVNPTPIVTLDGADETCINSGAISITANVTPAGTVISNYTWSTGTIDNGNQTITVSPNNIPTHTYSVEVETDKGCINTQSKDITVHPLPVVSFDSDGSKYVFCMDDTPASLTGSPLGGKFYVDGVELGANSFNPASYTQGDHNVEYFYQDGNGCESSFLRVFTVNAVPNVTLSGLQNQYCADAGGVTIQGSPDGSAYVPPIPGTFTSNPSHSSYFTDNGDGTADFDVASAISVQGPGNYIFTYTYTNNEGCDASATYTTTLLNDLGSTLSFSGLPANICQTASPVTLIPYNSGVQITPAPGTTISFTGPAGSITYDASNGTAEFDPAVAGAGNYTITLTYSDANGCAGSVSNTIQVGTPISIPGLGTEYCSSDAGPYTLLGSINGNPAVVNDGTTFDVRSPSGAIITQNQPNGAYDFIPSTLFGNYGGGVYKVVYKYTDGTGCSNTLTTNVTIIEELDATFTIGGDPYATAQSNYCIGDSLVALKGHTDLSGAKVIGSVSTNFTGNGVSGSGIIGGFFNPGDNAVKYHPTANTITHTVIHTVNGKSCQSPLETFNVYVPQVDVSISGLSPSFCTSDGKVTISASELDPAVGNAIFSATKNGNATSFLKDGEESDNTAEIDPSVGAGVYQITLDYKQIGDGCSKTITKTVEVFATDPVTFSGVTSEQKICRSSSPITLRGDIPNGGEGNFVEITPGLLNTGTDDLGNAVVLNDGVAILTPGDLPIGLYTIRYDYTNTNGCSAFSEKSIEIVGSPSTIYNVTGGGAYCIDDSPKGVTIGLNGSNTGVTYELLFGGTSLTPAVEYTGTGTSFNFTVNSDGTGGDKLFQTEGVYSVKAELGGCDAIMTGSVTVEQYELVLQQASKTNITCNGLSNGSVTLTCTGGSGSYEYSLNGSAASPTWQASPTFNGLAVGDHDFSVRDLSSAACEAIDALTVSITQPSVITITEIENIPVGCSGCIAGTDCEGSSTITISGGTPDYDVTAYPGVGYGIVWSTGETDLTETLMSAGNHSVTVTDGNGCTQNLGITISTNPVLTITENAGAHINNVCNGGKTGSYTVTAGGGSGTYEFSLTDPATTAEVWLPGNAAANQYQLNTLFAGSYNIWVRDANPIYNRCITQIATPIVITEPASLSLVEESQVGITCNGATDGSFVVRASNGESGTYEFTTDDPAIVAVPTWNAANNGADGYELSLLGAGTYTVWVRDLANPTCGYTSVDVTIADVTTLSYTLVEQTNVSCNTGNDGRLEVLGQGGSGNYVYSWKDKDGNFISNDPFIESLDAARSPYELTLSDVNDPLNVCGPLVQTFNISEPAILEVNNVVIEDADCAGQPTGSITLDVIGGTAPYTINWSTGASLVLPASGTVSINGLTAGNYNIDIEDASATGCTYNNAATPWTVGQLSPITNEIPSVITNNTCNGGINGSIYVKVDGGSGDYQFRLEDSGTGLGIINWSNSVSATMDDFTFTGLAEGDYDVIVRDLNNTNCVFTVGSYSLVDPPSLNLIKNFVDDVDCFSSANGSITVTASGGSGTYQFKVDGTVYNTGDNGAGYTATGLSAGNHTIYVRDSKDITCEYRNLGVINISEPKSLSLIVDVANTSNVSCNKVGDGEVTVIASGGSGNYVYSRDGWVTSEGGTGSSYTFKNVTPGSYTFEVKDADDLTCGSGTVSYTVTEPDDFTTTATVSNIKCYGESTGVITLSTSNGVGPFEYRVNGGSWQSSPIKNLAAGTYVVDVMDIGSGCIKDNVISAANATITQPDQLNYSVVSSNFTLQCNNDDNGKIEISVNGGNAPYYYQWTGVSDANGGKTNHAENLTAGTYNVSISDDNGCAILPLPEYTITEPDEIDVTYVKTDIAVGGLSTGSIEINNITGGPTTNYTVEWWDGNTSSLSRNNLPAGDYYFYLYVEDGSGNTLCSKRYDVTLIDQSEPLSFDLYPTDAICYGGDGNLEISVSAGEYPFDITWSQGGTVLGSTTLSTNNVHQVDLPAGDYEINVKDGAGGNLTKTTSVGQPDDFTVEADVASDKECFGDDATLQVIIDGDAWNNAASPKEDNFTVTWIDPDGLINSTGLFTTTSSVTNLTKSGDYTVSVYENTHNTCIKSDVVTVSDPLPLGITYEVTDVMCNSGQDGSITVTPTGRPAGHPFSYTWQINNGSNWASISGETAPTISNREAGTYRVVLQSLSSSCSYTSDAIVINEPDPVQAIVSTEDIITCYGDDSGMIYLVNIQGGTQPYRYMLNGAESSLADGVTNYDIKGLISQNYSIKLKDIYGCESEVYTRNISEPEELTFEITKSYIDCSTDNSGDIELTVDGGRKISGEQKYLITVSPDGQPDIMLDPVSNTTGASILVNDARLEGLAANRYVVKVYDLNSNATALCESIQEVTLEHITITGNESNVTCKGANNGTINGIVISGGSGDYTYEWTSSDGLGYNNNTLNQGGLSEGAYTLKVYDNVRKCDTIRKTFTIGLDNVITIVPTITDVSCNGKEDGAITLELIGNNVDDTSYAWTGPGTFSESKKDISDLTYGNYTVTMTTAIDDVSCKVDSVFTVEQPDALTFNTSFDYTNCDPYQRTLIVEDEEGGDGNYSYKWTGPAFTPAIPKEPTKVLITKGGTYIITVSDNHNCTLSKTLSVPEELSINASTTHVQCADGKSGAIDISEIYGGSGAYTFEWTYPDNTIKTSRNIDQLAAGNYKLVITDINERDVSGSCTLDTTFTVTEPKVIQIAPAVVDVSCYGLSDGQIEIGVQGGKAPYTYNWSPVVGTNSAGNKNQYDLPADDYNVTVTDVNGCNITSTITVTQDSAINTVAIPTETKCDGTGGAIDLSVTGGSGSGFTYNWSSANGTGLVVTNKDQTGLTGGTYTVQVSDNGPGRSCTASTSVTLTDAISIINNDVTPVTCSGNDDGTISYDVIGGDGNYTYSWNVISGDPTRIEPGVRNQSGLSEGKYQVTITDGRTSGGTNCAITKTFTVPAVTGLSVNVSVFNSKICYADSTGMLIASVTGGSGSYKYYWNGEEGSDTLKNIPQGIYGLKVVDVELGCNFVQSYEIKGPDARLSIDNIVVKDVLCYGKLTGEINVTASGGTVPSAGYTYTWTEGPSPAIGSNPTKLAAGTYRLTVLDANGCSVSSDEIIVSQPSTYIKVDNPQITDVSTVGGNNGQILVDVYDGTAPRSVEWFDASDTSIGTLNPATGLSSGTYRVVATDNNGCPAELTGIRVVEPGESLGFEKTVHQISPCNGGDNGEIHINRVFGGFPIDGDRYRIQITGPGTNVDIEDTSYDLIDLTPGTYRVVVTDDATETYQEDIVISEYTPLTLTTNKVSDVQCFGTATGEIEVIVGGGRPNASNNYLVEITSTEGYSDTKEDALSGVPFSFTNLPAGNYTVTLKDHAEDFDTKTPDRNNCELSDFTLITEPEANVELTSVSGLSEICQGETYNLSINTSNWDFGTQGNLRVSVYDDFTTTEYIVDQTPYVITVSPTSSRTYEITKVADPANAACLQGETTGNQIQLTVHDLPTATITGPTEVCEDGSVQLSVSFTGKAPFSFTWQDVNNGTSNTISGVYASDTTFTDDPVANAGYIVLSVSDDYSCSNAGNGQVDVTINNKPIITLAGSTDICAGESTSLTFGFNENNAPYTVTYEANGSEGTLLVTPDTDNNYAWNVSPDSITTTYKITSVIDANGCNMDISGLVQATVIVNLLPEPLAVINSTLDNDSICQGTIGIDYAVDPANYATNYVWTVQDGMTITSGNGTTNITVDFDRDFTGGYVRVYTENSCGETPAIEKWVSARSIPESITIEPTGDTDLCEGENGLVYSISPVANATSYEWSIPAGLILQGSGTGTSIIVDLDPNVPSTIGDIKVRPVNSCSSDEPWSPPLEVTVTPLPVADAGSDERICQTTYTLDAAPLNAGESGLWKILNGSGQYVNRSVDQVRPDAHVYNLSQGANTFLWTVTNDLTGCYTSDTVVIYNDQVTVNAIASSDKVCDGKVQLFGTPLNSVINADEAYWSTTGGAFIVSSTNENTNVTDLGPGSNSFTWTIRKGACYSTATVNVINNKPTEAVIYNASDLIIALQDLPCQTDFTSLKGSLPASDETGYWRIESGSVTIDDVNSPTINVTNIAKGDHEISWNIRKGDCLSKSIVTIRNNALDVDAGVDKYSCDGTTTLYGTEIPVDASGQWSVIEGFGNFASGSSATTDVSALAQENSGRNVFRWTLTRYGCESSDEVVIYNDQPSSAQIAGGNSTISICDYEYNLQAVTPVYGNGVWSVVGGQGRFDNPADPNTMVRNIAHGDNIFRWTVSNNTCSSHVDFTVTNLHVDAYAGADTAVCSKVARLNATPAPSGASGLWTIVSGEGGVIFNPSSSSATASATSLGHGTNTLVWTVTQNGCVSKDTVNIVNNQPYEVNATSYIYVDNDNTTLRADNPTVGDGVWSLLEGRGTISNPNSSTTTVTNLLPNFNYFRWTVTNVGCVEYVDVAVQSGVLAQADAGLDQLHLCEDFTSLQANEPEGTYGEWTIDEGSAVFESSNSAKTTITDIRPGRNVFRWTVRFAGGSENFTTDTVVVINNKPSDANGGIDIIECGDATVLNAREPIEGSPTWSVLSGGGIFVDNTDPKTAVSALAKGENVFKYEIKKDICFSYDTISVFNYEPSDAFAGNDQVVCVDSANLNPEIPKYGIGKWRIIEGSGKGRDENGNPIDEIGQGYVYDLAPGVNKLIWEVNVPQAAASCIKRDTLTIVNNKPSLSFAGHYRSICTDTVSLSGSVPVYGGGTWTLISGSGTIADSTQRNTLVTNVGKGKNRFRWTIDNDGCTSVSDVEISNNLIEAFAGYDQVNCVDTAILEGNNPVPGEGTWGVLGGSGSANFNNNESPYTQVRNLDKGENILTWTITYQSCQSVSQVTITNNKPSAAIAGDNKATCDSSIVLGASVPEVGTGKWTIRSGGGYFTDEYNASTAVDTLKFGKNVFRWTVENKGCILYDDVEISYNTIQASVGGTQEICENHTFLEGNNPSPGVGTWSVLGGISQARFANTNDPVSEVYDLAKGSNMLRWSINNQGCITSAEVNVINHSPSTAYAGNTQELCQSNTTLDATKVDIGTGSWEVLIGSATITADQINKEKAVVSGLSKGDNVFRWTVTSDNGLCTSADEIKVINNEPSEPYAGADEEYCAPTVVLKAATPDFGNGNWSIIEGGGNFNDPTLPNATISNLTEGNNVLRWTITQGQCMKQSDITITNNTPTTANAGPDIEDCKDYAFLDANMPTQGDGFWTLISGKAEYADTTNENSRVDNLTFGENILQWNIQKGSCISSDQITIFNQIPDQAKAGIDRSTCEDYLTLNANNPNSGIGTWTVISGHGDFDDASSPSSIVRNLGLGENRFKWTVAYGTCTTEDVVEIVSNKADPYAGEDDVTYKTSYELKASNPGDLGATWSVVAGTGEFVDETYFNTIVNDLNVGVNTFRWRMDVNGCITYDDVSIEYREVPDAKFIADTTQGCYPLTIQFTNHSDGGSEFAWDFGDGNSSTDRNPVHTFYNPGKYLVTMVAPGPDNVDGEYQMEINVHDHPVAEFSYGPDIIYVPDDLLRCYSLSVDAEQYLWDFGDEGTSTDVNPLHVYKEEGVYDLSLIVESKYGCLDTIVKPQAITTVLQGFVSFPNSFMPRPDGGNANSIGGGETNTVFRPVYRDVDQYQIQIFNRWGQLIFESSDIDEGWNGFYNGTLAPQAVYVWKVNGTFISGKVFNEAGSVLLVR